jgi:hypothetical protein
MIPSKSRALDRHFKMNIPQVRTIIKRDEYIIITFDTNQIFRGTFDDWDHREDILEDMNDTYYKIPGRNYCHYFNNHYFTCNNKKYKFNECDYYYDVTEFKREIKRSAEKARQQMEKRSLNIILKRVVNEHFEWL